MQTSKKFEKSQVMERYKKYFFEILKIIFPKEIGEDGQHARVKK